jgi:putative transposase
MAIKRETLDALIAEAEGKDPFGKDGLLDELKKALAERALNAELDHHLAHEIEDGRRNHRNGYSKKSVLTDTSKIAIEGRKQAGVCARDFAGRRSGPREPDVRR